MTINSEDLINSIMASLDRVKFVDSDAIPDIALYMDQVTTFMDEQLRDSSRYKDIDKILTKTMINNYAKNNLLPPPEKKKYSKEHILILILIYYFKNILSISDIQMMLNPLTEKYFGKDSGYSIKDIYDEVTNMGHYQKEELKKDVKSKYEEAGKAFQDAPEDEKESLQIFSFICMLSFDVYIKKLLVEKLLDEYAGKGNEKKDSKEKAHKEKS
ncbi:MAG: DUF1836 domain-containing protein [Lachnospiraceae bacterium]